MSENETVVFTGPESVVLEDRPVPEPAPDEVLVETTRSLISTGTELTVFSGDYPEDSNWDQYGSYPFDAGYSNVGEVVAVGDDVESLAAGDRVATRAPHRQYAAVAAGDCVPVPDSVPAEEAAFFALAGIAMNGLRRGGVDWGETVAVYGLGLVGQLASRFCHVAGARPVVGFDIAPDRVEYLPERPSLVGADPETDDPQAVVRDAANERLADVVFEATGLPDVLPTEFEVLREQGTFVVLSSPRGTTEFDFHDLCNGPSYDIVGAHELSHAPVATPRDPWTHERHYELFFDLLDDGSVDIGDLVSHRVPHDDAPETYERLLADRSEAMGVVFEWD